MVLLDKTNYVHWYTIGSVHKFFLFLYFLRSLQFYTKYMQYCTENPSPPPLKGVCQEILDLQFFSWFEPTWAPDKQAEKFSNSFRFRRDIRIFKKLRGVHPTAESSDEMFSKNSAVCIPPQSQTLRCASYRRVNLDNLSSVCFNQKFYECYLSVMPKDIHMKLIL